MLKKSAAPKNAGRRLTFVLPGGVAGRAGERSRHLQRLDAGGPRAAPPQQRDAQRVGDAAGRLHVRFRYLGEDGHWFDDQDADEVTSQGGTVHL